MNLPSEWQELVDGYLDGTISEEDFASLKENLRENPEARDRYLASVRVDTLLREISGKTQVGVKRSRLWLVMLVACFVIGLGLFSILRPEHDAQIESSTTAGWLSNSLIEGDVLSAGDQVKLASGKVEIRFRSGALTRIHGPALFEIESANSAFLHYGEAFSQADNPNSHGFTIRTRAGDFVDQGTEFLTTASPDGFSQMHVASGAVDVVVKGFNLERFETGSGLGIEPGKVPVIIRIEKGDETADFHFPTIAGPSNSDFAKNATVRLLGSGSGWEDIEPHPDSGPPRLVVDGKGQAAQDQPRQSLFIKNGASGNILLDLGREVPVEKIHTFSWHLSEVHIGTRRRAVQRYTLWGCGEEKPSRLPNSGRPEGWTRIARVDTDAFFQVVEEPDRPAQQACALFSNGPSLGSFRYLLFAVIPTPMPEGLLPQHTFFGEIDVFTISTN